MWLRLLQQVSRLTDMTAVDDGAPATAVDDGAPATEFPNSLPLFGITEKPLSPQSSALISSATSEFHRSLVSRSRDLAARVEGVQVHHVENAREQLVARPLDWSADFGIMFVLPLGYMFLGIFFPAVLRAMDDSKGLSGGEIMFGLLGVLLVGLCYGANANRFKLKTWLLTRKNRTNTTGDSAQ